MRITVSFTLEIINLISSENEQDLKVIISLRTLKLT